jgi:predicted  nucleic acid-binding Zn-ribbon protein
MSLADRLYQLQRLDQEVDTKRRRLAEVQSAIEDTQAVQKARQRLSAASNLALGRTVKQTNLDLELQGLVNKMTRETERLYGGSVRNPKELGELQEEVASLERRQARIEDSLLQAMIDSEEADAALEAAREHLATQETALRKRQSTLGAEKLVLSQRIADLAAERASVAAEVGAGDVARYESLRKRKGGLAVAGVVGDACAACGVAVSSNRKWHIREGDLVHCANCERIIVLL